MAQAKGSGVKHAKGGDPRQVCRDWLAALGPGEQSLLQVDFELSASWLESESAISLTALYLCRDGGLEVSVTDRHVTIGELEPAEQFDYWVQRHQLFVAHPGRVLPLCPREVAKPWGREIWYTGIERRGVCEFGGDEHKTPMPWLLAALPADNDVPPRRAQTLLKILAPLADPVIGDLYFELHDVKQEVYVVTHVDSSAWPDGVGYLRFGFCPRRIAASKTEADFRREYLDAVVAYRGVRDQLDALTQNDSRRTELYRRETRLRAAMEEFILFRPVRTGDVIEIPRQLPHGLLHGVTVVEFQTPVFERKILSSSQRVLTQSKWDTEEAVATMRLSAPGDENNETRLDRPDPLLESIANPGGFEVRRLNLEVGESASISAGDGDGVMIVLRGQVSCSGSCFGPEQAGWLPAGWQGDLAVHDDQGDALVLLALTGS